MKGLDFSTFMAFFLTLASVGLCVVYGVRNWNKGGEITPQEAMEEARWDQEEREVEKEFPGGSE